MTLEETLLERYRGKAVLLDSNLLLVFISGTLGRAAFARFKRVSDYSYDDYELLVGLLGAFKTLLTTPHILTEVSNLANSLPEWYKSEWYENFAALISTSGQSTSLDEKWTPASELSTLQEFDQFGITYAALTRLSREGLVITSDYRLSSVLRSRALPVINFQDLRKLRELIQKNQ